MNNELTIGFVGFGEAGFHLATGLRGAGVARLYAYDINTKTAGLGDRIRHRAQASDVNLLDSSQSLARTCDLIFSAVTANAAIEAAEQTLPFLQDKHFYADLDSVSPATKQAIEQLVETSGAHFVEGAIMAPVPRHGHRVPILLGGKQAEPFRDLLAPFGMRLEIVSASVGTASAVKMCRSIIVKGLEALLLECALAATRYDASERVFASLDETLPGIDWSKLAGYMISRIVEHGERRAREMEEVADMLRAAGIEPLMAEATSRRQQWGAQLNLLDRFDGKAPQDYRELIEAITKTTTNANSTFPRSLKGASDHD